jgi:formate dehydrogenase major subunit
VAVLNSLAHVIVTEQLGNEEYVRARCEIPAFEKWLAFITQPKNSPEALADETGVPAELVRGAAGSTPPAGAPRSTTAWA